MSNPDYLRPKLRDNKQPGGLSVPMIHVPQHEHDALVAERDALTAYVRELEGELRCRGIPWGEVLLGSDPQTIDEQILQMRQRNGVDSMLS